MFQQQAPLYRLTSLLVALLLGACGRTEHNAGKTVGYAQAGEPPDSSSSGASSGGSSSGGPPEPGGAGPTQPSGGGPIDPTGLPDSLAACPEPQPTAIKLPCHVGQNILGAPDQPGLHVVECELQSSLEPAAVSFMLPLSAVPGLLNQPVHLPLDGTVMLPAAADGTSTGLHVLATLGGIITFTQVDVAGRGFVAKLEQGQIQWGGDPMADFNCTTVDGRIWGVAGNFL